jgi:F-type H+-transporting ATPase subunit delta
MATRLSRRKIAAYAADELLAGKPVSKVLAQVAAYLVTTRRTRESELLVRDIEYACMERGVVATDVASAHALTPALRTQIEKLVDADKVQLRETIDPALLGGVRIDIPGKRFDGTLQRKITALKANQW